MSGAIKLLLLFVISNVALISAKPDAALFARECKFDPRKDLHHSQILYLHPNVTQFVYPERSDSLSLIGDGPVLRIVCPAGKITMRDTITTDTSILVQCVSGKVVKVMGTHTFSDLKDIGCSERRQSVSQITNRKTPNGKKLAEVGFDLGPLDFVTIIDELAVQKLKSGYVPLWAHYKMHAAAGGRRKTVHYNHHFRAGKISENIDYEKVYDRENQRKALMSASKSQKFVDKYLPSKGTEKFVTAQLVYHEDFYYELQQNSTYLYEMTSPVWKSVEVGNWKLVNEAVHNLMADNLHELDIWSGTYVPLVLHNGNDKITVQLNDDLIPGHFLFKYVYDRTNNRGVVFVTINNPFITEIKSHDTLCKSLDICKTMYPQFMNLTKGYTYCCSFMDFKTHAIKLGLPVFPEVKSF